MEVPWRTFPGLSYRYDKVTFTVTPHVASRLDKVPFKVAAMTPAGRERLPSRYTWEVRQGGLPGVTLKVGEAYLPGSHPRRVPSRT